MRLRLNQCVAGMAVGFAAMTSPAAIHYVDASGTNPVSPYTNWVTAATNIQNAVDAASSGELILVTNGVYATGGRIWSDSGTNRVTLTNSATLQSVNGPAVTMIVGGRAVGASLTTATRCVGMGNNAVLSGFTLTNGEAGGGNYPSGGGVAGITAGNCTVTNCVLIGNLATNSLGGGAYRATLINCKLIGNSAGKGGGASACALVNCLVVSNTATSSGGGVYGDHTTGVSSLTNCTIVGNAALSAGGGVNNGGNGAMNNCLAYYNIAPSGSNYANITLNNCCTVPILAGDLGSTSNAPCFVNLAGGDFHLLPWSPCLNAGSNSYAAAATDLDGNPRIIAGTVDIGAYEFQSPVHFVNAGNTAPASPFTDWPTAATNIQDAVDAATNGDLVLVTNGIYAFGGRDVYGSNRVAVTSAITVESINGPGATMILGQTNGVNVRCVFLTNSATLAGFTLTNGSSSGSAGGVLSSGFNDSTISNCVIIGNLASSGGGGVSGSFYNCTLTGNYANNGGGIFAGNMYNCLVASNSAADGGGCYSGTAYNCRFIGNTAGNGGGGYNSFFQNCLLTGNVASGSFGGGAAYQSTIENCTVVANQCTSFNGGTVGGAYHCGAITSSIVYNNTSFSQAGTPNYSGGGFIYNSCTTPLPGNGFGNFTSDPALVNPAGGDFHLQSNSPCINAGNNSYATSATDLDGNARIVAGTVDVGAYEYQTPASAISYAWLQQYGLAINAGTDTADADGDGMSNYAEWRAGTNPTNALSLLQMTSAVPANNASGVTIAWQSASGINYLVQRGSDLIAQPVFTTVATGIAGQAGVTSYTDATATNNLPYFYRVGVQ